LTNLYLHGELLPINATIIQKHELLFEVLNVICFGKINLFIKTCDCPQALIQNINIEFLKQIYKQANYQD
jgi:hypothetical protein